MDFLKASIDTEGAAAFLEELACRVRTGEMTIKKMKADEQNIWSLDDEPQLMGRQGDLKMTWEVAK